MRQKLFVIASCLLLVTVAALYIFHLNQQQPRRACLHGGRAAGGVELPAA